MIAFICLSYASFVFPLVSTMIIPTTARTTALTTVSITIGNRDLYIVVIENMDRSIVAVNRAPNKAPVFKPSEILRAPDQLRNNVRNNAISRFDRIIAHHIISSSGEFAQVLVMGEKKL